MNIIVLDENPEMCAKYYTDTHVVNLLTNYTQLLSNAYYRTFESDLAPYKPFNINMPVPKWVCESRENWEWLYNLNLYLYMEYLNRFGNKIHKAGQATMNLTVPKLPSKGRTEFVIKVPEECRVVGLSAVESYRHYYRMYMADEKLFKRGEIPAWMKGGNENYVDMPLLRSDYDRRRA